jgi:hypothetical protein
VGFRLPKVLEQNKRPQTLKVLEHLCNFFQPNLIVLPRLDSTKIEKNDTEGVSGHFNGHPRHQAV